MFPVVVAWILQGEIFFKYLDEHASTLDPKYDYEEIYCTHAGHTWMPVKYLLTALKIAPTTYERKFLNSHQLFDDTSYQLLTYLQQRHSDLSLEEKEAVLYLHRCCFNDHDRFLYFCRLHGALDEVMSNSCGTDPSVFSSLCQNRFLIRDECTDLSLRKALFMESMGVGAQPHRGYSQGSQGAARGESRFSAIAQNTMKLLQGSTFEVVVGDYNFYKFLVDIDKFYFSAVSSKARQIAEWSKVFPISFVGVGCPGDLAKVAPG